MSINKVFITGNLTREPELRTTQGGTTVLGFGVAVNDRRKNSSTGQWEDVPNYVDCVMFGNRANSMAQYVGKGSKVSIEGHLRWHSWQDQQTGQNRSKLDVIVDEIEFMVRQQQPQQAPADEYIPF